MGDVHEGKSDMINVAALQDTWEAMQAEEHIHILI